MVFVASLKKLNFDANIFAKSFGTYFSCESIYLMPCWSLVSSLQKQRFKKCVVNCSGNYFGLRELKN